MLSDDNLRRLSTFRSRIVAHPAFAKQIARIKDAIHKSGKIDDVQSIAICGPAGVGKSAIGQEILAQFPPTEKETELGIQRVVPVVFCSFPSKCSSKSIVKEVASELGHHIRAGITEDDLERDLRPVFDRCENRILIFDETQHLLKSMSDKELTIIMNFLKALINRTGRPLVLLGDRSISSITSFNDQISDRFLPEEFLKDFRFPEDKGAYLYQTVSPLFEIMEEDCRIGLSRELDTLLLVQRIFFASGGNMRAIRRVLQNAIEKAMLDKSRVLKNEHFAAAFMEAPSKRALSGENPFKLSPRKIKDKAKSLGY